jgi:hypothetical protein
MTTKKPEFNTAAKSTKPKVRYGSAHDLHPLGGGKRTEKDGRIGNIFIVGKGKDKMMVEEFKTEREALREVEDLQNMPGHGTAKVVSWVERKQKTNARRKPVTTKRKLVGRCK